MIVRPASLQDRSAIVEWGKGKHAESTYAPIAYNAAHFRKVLTQSLNDAEHCVFIARRHGEICGLLIGMRMPLLMSPLYCATDLVFVADAGGGELLSLFMAWCKTKKVQRIDMGMSQGDHPALDRLMRRKGFTRAGGMYYKQEVRTS